MKKAILLFIAIAIAAPGFSQYLRTSYFMESATNRIQLNPALHPTQGFIDIPVAGAFHASASSNTLGVEDVIDIIDDGEDFRKNDKLFRRLQTDNRFNVNANTDIASFGFYRGKGFWSGNIGVRSDINASIPGEMLRYARDFFDPTSGTTGEFEIRNQSLKVNLYTEIGVGYSRIITDKLTLGAKVKMLLGIGNMDFKVDRLYIKEAGTYSEIEAIGHLDATMKGMDLETVFYDDDDKEYVESIDFDKFGIAGYGMGIDLGATYKVMDNLTLSASVLDIGFISWSKNSTKSAVADRNTRIDYGDIYGYIVNDDGIFDPDLPGFALVDPKSRTTSLAATMVVGGEYVFFNNKLSAGILSVTRFTDPKTITELTFSGNYRPKKWLNATLSYSVLQSHMKTFGLGLKIGPVFIGTDYMLLERASETRNVNAYIGISIPLGGRKDI